MAKHIWNKIRGPWNCTDLWRCSLCERVWQKKVKTNCPGVKCYTWKPDYTVAGCPLRFEAVPYKLISEIELAYRNLKPTKNPVAAVSDKWDTDSWFWLYDRKETIIDNHYLPPVVSWYKVEAEGLVTERKLKELGLIPVKAVACVPIWKHGFICEASGSYEFILFYDPADCEPITKM